MIENYKQVVDYIFQTYKTKYGLPYPFKGVDGKIVKWLLAFYEPDQVRALWDAFLCVKTENLSYTTKDGRYVKRMHNLMVFQSSISDLIEQGDWKRFMGPRISVPVTFKTIEHSRIGGY